MRSESNFQQIVALVLAVIAVIILLELAPSHNFLPRGIVLPAKEARAPTKPKDVHIYRQLPLVYQKVGSISIEMHAASLANRTSDQTMIINKAKSLAAKVGANGVVFNISYNNSNEGSALSGYYLMGYAIYTVVPSDLNWEAL